MFSPSPYRFSNKWFLNTVMNICTHSNPLPLDIASKPHRTLPSGRSWPWASSPSYRSSTCWGWWGVGASRHEDSYSWAGAHCMEHTSVGRSLCTVCGRTHNHLDKWQSLNYGIDHKLTVIQEKMRMVTYVKTTELPKAANLFRSIEKIRFGLSTRFFS